ncbi:hypothetical protein M427DRAFT_40161 [Gonapodya prolifera JEL478]|uniref:EH domain-containing protein n=1 Tax=Gonapodya prolifera (strain JEL478) TaxID=1344416 RepID=A0A139B0F7_GONPJ|nr:hypothetical protein M427DRAFT_40161 [Gonapodya prolifera JEL478]|eukprot:KXS22185.1 hypothetical protein M427DRAFT_40161 [Gonapodya prolifera JEL478]
MASLPPPPQSARLGLSRKVSQLRAPGEGGAGVGGNIGAMGARSEAASIAEAAGLSLSSDEISVYSQLFSIGDVTKKGFISADHAVPLLTRSKLPQATLAEIWQLGDEEGKGFLTQSGFYRVLKLVAVAQQGQPVMLNLLSMKTPPPTFEGLDLTPTPIPTLSRHDSSPLGGDIFSSPSPSGLAAPAPAAAPIPPPAAVTVTSDEKARFASTFAALGPVGGAVTREQAGRVFMQSGLPPDVLRGVWTLVDPTSSNRVTLPYFSAAMNILSRIRSRDLTSVPTQLPAGLVAQFESPQPTTPLLGPSQPAASAASSLLGAPLSAQSTSTTSTVLGAPRSFAAPLMQSQPQPPTMAKADSFASLVGFGSSTGSGAGVGAGSKPASTVGGGLGLGFGVAPAGTLGGGAEWGIPAAERVRYGEIFEQTDVGKKGYLSGEEAVEFFVKSRLSQEQLAQIWDLSTVRKAGQLSRDEFSVAMHLIRQARSGIPLPSVLPVDLVPPTLRNLTSTPQAAPPQASALQQQQQTQNSNKDLFDFDFGSPSLAPVPLSKPPALVDLKGPSGGAFGTPPTSGFSLSNLTTPIAAQPAVSPASVASPSMLASSPPSAASPANAFSLETAQKDLARARVELRMGETQISETQQQASALVQQRSMLEQELRTVGEQKREMAVRVATARNEVEALRRANAELEAAVRREQAEIAAGQDEVQRRANEAEEARSAAEAMEMMVVRARSEAEHVKGELRAAEERTLALRQQVERLRVEERTLRAQAEQAKQQRTVTVQQAELANREKVELEKTNDALRDTISAAGSVAPRTNNFAGGPLTPGGTPIISRPPPPPPPTAAAKTDGLFGLDLASSATGLGLIAGKKSTLPDKGKEHETLQEPAAKTTSLPGTAMLSPPGDTLRGNSPSPFTDFQAKFPEMPGDIDDPFTSFEQEPTKVVPSEAAAPTATLPPPSPPQPNMFEADFSSAFGNDPFGPPPTSSAAASPTTSNVQSSPVIVSAPAPVPAPVPGGSQTTTSPQSATGTETKSEQPAPETTPGGAVLSAEESFPSMEDFEAEFDKAPKPGAGDTPMSPSVGPVSENAPPPVPALSLKPGGAKSGHSPNPSVTSGFEAAFGAANVSKPSARAQTPDLESEFKDAFGPTTGAPPSELALAARTTPGKDLTAFDFDAEFTDDAFKFTSDFGGTGKPPLSGSNPLTLQQPTVTSPPSSPPPSSVPAFDADFSSAFSQPFQTTSPVGTASTAGDPFAAAFGPSVPGTSSAGGARMSWDLDTVFGPGGSSGGPPTTNGKDPFGSSPTFGATTGASPPAFSAPNNAFEADFSAAFSGGAVPFDANFSAAPAIGSGMPSAARPQQSLGPDKDLAPEVKEVISLTGASADKAFDALVKYDMDVQRAVNYVLG